MAMVKELRAATGAPVLQCKKALDAPDVNGDFSAAVKWLREQGMAKAATKAHRVAQNGLVGVAASDDGNSAVLVEVRAAPEPDGRHSWLVHACMAHGICS